MCQKKSFDFWTKLKLVCICNTAINIVSIPFSIVIAQLLSNLMTHAIGGEVTIVVKSAVIVTLLLIINIIFQTVGNICIHKYQARVESHCRTSFLKVLLQNPLDRIFKIDHGELVENLNNDMNTSINCFVNSYPYIITSVVSTLGYTTFFAVKNITVACSLLALSLIQFIPPMIVKKHMQTNYDKCRDMEAKITNHIVEAVNGFETIKLYGLKCWWQNKMTSYYNEYLPIGRKTDATAAAQRTMYRALDNILKFGTYAIMGIYVISNLCSVEIAIQAIYLSGSIFASVKTIFFQVPEIAVARIAQKRINKWVPSTIKGDLECLDAQKIVLNNLCFNYGEKHILNETNISFDSNKNYMIEGENGIGKTTLFNLLMGFELPQSGQVMIDESIQNIYSHNISPSTLLYIPQTDPEFGFDAAALFKMFNQDQQKEILDLTIRFGLTKEKLKNCKISDLSGGERKKVFLSIGFAINSQWLLLDEPTNNLDAHGILVLKELISTRTGIIIISHNTTLRSLADQIIRIENGCVFNENQYKR